MNTVKMTQAKPNRRKTSPVERYHHGDLKTALIEAADRILAEHGVAGFSLREAARRAGVSPAAPAHHFGSAAGLLSEVAILGFEELAHCLDVDPAAGTPTQRMRMQGVGYVRFALTYPGRFHLMFRHDLLSPDHAALQAAGDRTLMQLEQTIRAMRSLPPQQPLDASARAELLAAWSMVHGFAHLALDGKLAQLHADAPSSDLLSEVLPKMLENRWPDA
ncbi:TetR/AcrR family transcriptional regulator [Lysobacter sp. CA199]|uniref:TetR/AcrR family transcriptional regulator n=1 Tax=Lysobacter sp. CA199 TaxID=3455608 RepID=UPI003F8CF86A